MIIFHLCLLLLFFYYRRLEDVEVIMVKEKSIHTTVITNMQHSAAMHAAQVKIYRRKNPPRRLSVSIYLVNFNN